uniref:Pco115279a n=1 Tax=Arundo donax TaxID=35708 RepID=A0A0A9A7S6_ARUDO
MRHAYVRGCEFVAMFDADFQPAPDFLVRTIPFLVHNPSLAFVQTRWKFMNANDCLLTRMQEMSMDYHFKVEQDRNCFFHAASLKICFIIQELPEYGEHKLLSNPVAGRIELLLRTWTWH